MILLLLGLISLLVVVAGVVLQAKNISEPDFMIPMLFAVYFLFFLIIGINGISKGNILLKWNLPYFYELTNKIFYRTFFNSAPAKRSDDSTKVFQGVCAVLLAMVCAYYAIVTSGIQLN